MSILLLTKSRGGENGEVKVQFIIKRVGAENDSRQEVGEYA